MKVSEKLAKLYFKQMKNIGLISDYDTEEDLKVEAQQIYTNLDHSEEHFLRYIYESWVSTYEKKCLDIIKELSASGFDKDFVEKTQSKLKDKQIEEWLNFKRESKNENTN